MKRTLLTLLILSLSLASIQSSAAQDAISATVLSGHLINPHAIAIGPDGALYVAEAGSGGETTASDTGHYANGPTGRISRIDNGCPVTVLDGFPSARASTGEVFGPAGIAFLGERSFVLSAGGGASHNAPDAPVAVFETTAGGNTLIADLSAWLASNPVANSRAGADPDGVWTSLIANPDGTALIAVEQSHGQVVQIGLDGTITRLADLSANYAAPVDAAINPDGTLEVALFSADPHAEGTSSVVAIRANGEISPVWTGLTMAVALTFDPNGIRLVAEFSEGRTEPPYFVPGSGRIVRQTGPDAGASVATDVNFPGDLLFASDGSLLVALPSVGSESGTGQIISLIPGDQPIALQSTPLSEPTCGGEITSNLVKVSDMGLDPSTLNIAAGSSVTWRNTGEFDHAVASDPSSPLQWDSGVLTPGMEYTVTFANPGTYTYFDGLFPERSGEVIVQ